MLNVVSIEGGNDLRFNGADISSNTGKQVRVRITSTSGEPFQVYQRILEPLMNERGETVNRPVIRASSLVGSNALGTLYLQDLEPISLSDQHIYSSDTSGNSDSFTVIYQVDPQAITASGNLLGKIIYSVRTLGGSSHEDVVLSVSIESAGELKVETQSSSGIDQVHLNSTTLSEGYLRIMFENNVGSALKIFQEVIQPPTSDLNEEINEDYVHVSIAEGATVEGISVVKTRRTLIYSTEESSDLISLHFKVNPDDLQKQKAGKYRGQLRYSIETGGTPKIVDISLEIDVMPVFKLSVDYPPGGMNFSRILPNTPPQEREVLVTVKTNLNQPYAVTQNTSSPLSNAKGFEIPSNYFVMRMELDGASPGKIQFSDFAPVPIEDTIIYYSDTQGSPATFKAVYQLSPYSAMEAGNYQTAMMYSLSEL